MVERARQPLIHVTSSPRRGPNFSYIPRCNISRRNFSAPRVHTSSSSSLCNVILHDVICCRPVQTITSLSSPSGVISRDVIFFPPSLWCHSLALWHHSPWYHFSPPVLVTSPSVTSSPPPPSVTFLGDPTSFSPCVPLRPSLSFSSRIRIPLFLLHKFYVTFRGLPRLFSFMEIWNLLK